MSQEITVETPAQEPIETRAPVRASQMCRCGRGPKVPAGLFCGSCLGDYAKLFTTPASREFGICDWGDA